MVALTKSLKAGLGLEELKMLRASLVATMMDMIRKEYSDRELRSSILEEKLERYGCFDMYMEEIVNIWTKDADYKAARSEGKETTSEIIHG